MAKGKRTVLPKESTNCIACEYIASEVDENHKVKEAVNRGLCGSHAQAATKTVKKLAEEREISTEEAWGLLVAAGKALAPSRRSMSDWFLQGV